MILSRKNIYDVINSASFDIEKEYKRVYDLFYSETLIKWGYKDYSISQLAHVCFRDFDKRFRGRAISLTDFCSTYGYNFIPPASASGYFIKEEFDSLGYLIKFIEYVYNVTHQLLLITLNPGNNVGIIAARKTCEYLFNFIADLVDGIGYSAIFHEGIYIFIETNPQAMSVAEIVDDKLSFKVIEYNHHRLKGDLSAKLAILKLAADDIEPQRKILNGINKTLADNLFQMFQKFIRHNNEDNEYIKKLSKSDLELCYDDVYQMWLLAKLEIDNLERKKRVEFVLHNINAK